MDLSRYLSPSETVVLVTRRHIWSLAREILLFVLTALLALLVTNQIIAFIALGVSIRFLWLAADWFTDRLVLTSQRIMGITGLITRHISSMPLAMMTDLTYQRSLTGRLLGFGTMRVESAGQEQGLSKINFIPDPDYFYRTVATLLHTNQSVQIPEPVVELEKDESNDHTEEALELVRRGRPRATWDPDDTNPDMIVLP